MKKNIIKLLALTMLLTGCNIERQHLAYTVYPIGFILEKIVGNEMEVISIQENQIVQKAKLKEDYIDILNESSALFHLGELEPYIQTHYQDIIDTDIDVLDLASFSAIYPFQRYTRILVDNQESFIEGPYYHSSEFDLIDINDRDLFLWVDPISVISMARNIKDFLANNLVEKSKIFNDNFDILEVELLTLDAQYQELSTYCRENEKVVKFVSMTASFGNWQKNYGFQVYPVILSKYGSLPNSFQLDIIKQKIIDDDVKYIAYEPNMTPEMVELFYQLEKELNLTRINLSNLSSQNQSQIDGGQDYLTIMYENLAVLENIAEDIKNTDVETEIDKEEIVPNTDLD